MCIYSRWLGVGYWIYINNEKWFNEEEIESGDFTNYAAGEPKTKNGACAIALRSNHAWMNYGCGGTFDVHYALCQKLVGN